MNVREEGEWEWVWLSGWLNDRGNMGDEERVGLVIRENWEIGLEGGKRIIGNFGRWGRK